MEFLLKILSLIEIFENPDFFWRNFQKSPIWYKIFKNLDFGPNFRKIWILVQIFENVHFGKKNLETSILVKILEKIDILSKRLEILISVKIYIRKILIFKFFSKISIFFQNLPNSQFWSKFPKMWNFCHDLGKSLHSGQSFQKCRFR